MTKGGHSSFNLEHAWGDGVSVVRLINEMYKDAKNGMTTAPACHPTLDGVTRLQFDLSDSLKNTVEEAKKEVEENTRRLSVNTMQYMKYGRNALKKHKLSADAIMQLAIQVSFTLYVQTVLDPNLTLMVLNGLWGVFKWKQVFGLVIKKLVLFASR